MTRSALSIQECCSWCRKPASRCTDPSCDDAPTYEGVLLRGEWKPLNAETREAGQREMIAG